MTSTDRAGAPAPAADQQRSAEILACHRDPRNLTTALYTELVWKDDNLRVDRYQTHEKLRGGDAQRRACPVRIVDYCRAFREQHGRPARALDFACGPVPTLSYLASEGLAELTAVDTIGAEYNDLYRVRGVRNVAVDELEFGIGEFLLERYAPESFDVVWVTNALDHTQAPALVWLNLFRLTRVGGLLAHYHNIREAQAQDQRQLHQFDLYPRGESLWCHDPTTGQELSLTDGLPLRSRWNQETRDTPHHPNGNFTAGYERVPGEVDAGLTEGVLAQVLAAFRRRSQWAFELERLVADLAADHDPRTRTLPIPIRTDRA